MQRFGYKSQDPVHRDRLLSTPGPSQRQLPTAGHGYGSKKDSTVGLLRPSAARCALTKSSRTLLGERSRAAHTIAVIRAMSGINGSSRPPRVTLTAVGQ